MLVALTIAIILATIPSSAQVDSTRLLESQQTVQTLQQQWQQMWRASDSLRIASVLLRLKADSLARVVKQQQTMLASAKVEVATEEQSDTTDEILRTLQLSSSARIAEQKLHLSKPKRGQTLSDSVSYQMLALDPDTGMASYYAGEFHGKRTSNGEVFDMHQPTCAHRWLPFGTLLKVTNLDNGKEVVVRVTDRGPFKHGRIIDVSKGAAVTLDMIRKGTARVRIAIHTVNDIHQLEDPQDADTSNMHSDQAEGP